MPDIFPTISIPVTSIPVLASVAALDGPELLSLYGLMLLSAAEIDSGLTPDVSNVADQTVKYYHSAGITLDIVSAIICSRLTK